MTMVVTEPCIGCKDKACLPLCPTDCFYEDADMVYINPDDCIDCEACIAECPTEAIFYEDDVPAQWFGFIKLNAEKSQTCPPAKEDTQ